MDERDFRYLITTLVCFGIIIGLSTAGTGFFLDSYSIILGGVILFTLSVISSGIASKYVFSA